MLIDHVQKRIQQLGFLRDGAAMVRNPYDLKAILRLSDRVLEMAAPEEIQHFAEELCKEPQALRAIETRLRVNPDPERLRKLPEGTFGRAYAEHLDRNGITPESLKPVKVVDDITYVSAYLYETHDIWHALTGFGTSVAHELGLAAFGAAQLPSKFEYLLLSGGLLNTTFYEFGDRNRRMDAIARGWRMGRKARPLFGVDWKEFWKRPLGEVRAELGISRPIRRKLGARAREEGSRRVNKVAFSHSLVVRATPERVWDFTQDWARRPLWDMSVAEAELLSTEPRRLRVRAPGGLRFEVTYRKFERPAAERLGMTTVAMTELNSRLLRGGGGSWRYETAPGGYTRWSQHNTLVLREDWLGRALRPLFALVLAYSTRRAMRRARKQLEP